MKMTLPKPAISAPRLLHRRVITVNVEAQGVRVLVVKGDRVITWGEEPLAPGLVREGVVADPAAVAPFLKSLFASHRLLGGKLVVSVTGLRSIPRTLDLPKMEPKLMGTAVLHEAKREMPVPLEEIYLSWQPLETDNGHQRIFALGVPRDTIDPLLKAITLAGKRAGSVDIKPLALARAVDRRDAIIADLESDSVDVVIVKDGMPALMRAVVIRADGADGGERVERFREELVRTVKFYNDTHRQEPIAPSTPLFLTGALALEAAAAEAAISLESLVQYPIEPLAPPLECPPDFPAYRYAVNIGLALKEV